MADVQHQNVTFSGRVQGVGFRYQTLQIAREYEIAGFVTNLADGRVLVEAQGRESEIDAFIAAIEERMHGYIRKVERSAGSGTAAYQGFSIR